MNRQPARAGTPDADASPLHQAMAGRDGDGVARLCRDPRRR
ncbi:hypothetical protein [Sphingomonas hankookensis]